MLSDYNKKSALKNGKRKNSPRMGFSRTKQAQKKRFASESAKLFDKFVSTAKLSDQQLGGKGISFDQTISINSGRAMKNERGFQKY